MSQYETRRCASANVMSLICCTSHTHAGSKSSQIHVLDWVVNLALESLKIIKWTYLAWINTGLVRTTPKVGTRSTASISKFSFTSLSIWFILVLRFDFRQIATSVWMELFSIHIYHQTTLGNFPSEDRLPWRLRMTPNSRANKEEWRVKNEELVRWSSWAWCKERLNNDAAQQTESEPRP